MKSRFRGDASCIVRPPLARVSKSQREIYAYSEEHSDGHAARLSDQTFQALVGEDVKPNVVH